MYRAAVLGDIESIKGFTAVGLDVYPCDNAEQAAPLFRKLAAGGYGVIFVTEETAQWLEKEIRAVSEQVLPSVIPIPGVKGNTGLGIRRLKESVERAVGSDIIFNN
ncbi:MAG: V-type ATP synthase subunit F [Clostridia bacterium]|nr:V-type ATP synthase subunit F [Clostridia bacterium]